MAAATGVRIKTRRPKDHDELLLVVLVTEGFDSAIGDSVSLHRRRGKNRATHQFG